MAWFKVDDHLTSHPFSAIVGDEALGYWMRLGCWLAKFPTALRASIYQRDGYQCVECASTEDLSLDHIWPWSKGGQDTLENLRTLCRPCNSRKGARV